MTTTPRLDREAVARIIDPDTWQGVDLIEHPAFIDDTRAQPSLAKADAILAHLTPAEPSDDLVVGEIGWLIEHGGPVSTLYWTGEGWGHWSGDHLAACRFARREDAFRVSLSLGDTPASFSHKVVEHAWPAAALASMQETIAGLEVERNGLQKLVYVPGVLRCAKCALRLITTTLNASGGSVSANNDPHTCPNGCGPMWRITERDAGNDLCDRLDIAEAALVVASAGLDKLKSSFFGGWFDPDSIGATAGNVEQIASEALAQIAAVKG